MKNGFWFEQLFNRLLNYAYSIVIMFKDNNITLRRGIIMLPMYNKTIVARCDFGSMGFVHPRLIISASGVQNAMDPVTACNNCILFKM